MRLSTRPYITARWSIGLWQLASTLLLYAGIVVLLAVAHPAAALLLLPLTAGLLVRLFVLQHDCSHGSLLPRASSNERIGQALSAISGVGFAPWQAEHAWHHVHQGKLSMRGIDRMNSPMTVGEAAEDPAGAAKRIAIIAPHKIAVLGAISLALSRKRTRGFFPFRPSWRWPIPDEAALRRSLSLTLLSHAAVHLVYLALLGPWRWALLLLPAHVLAAMTGALLFWVQHNFEHTWHAGDGDWDFQTVALQGSSFLKLPGPLRWFTASIGLHHVHHLDPRIPNYRLEEARREIPALASIPPLSRADLRRCFTHVFWDGAAKAMVRRPARRSDERAC